MLQVIVASILASAVVDADAVQKLAAAAEKLVAAESYKFEVTTKSEGGGFPGGGGPPSGSEDPVKGTFQKTQPVYLTRGSTEVFRSDSTSLFKGSDGKWQKIDPQSAFGGRRGGNRPPGGDDGGGGESGDGGGGRRRNRGGADGGAGGGDAGGGGESGGGGEAGGGGRRRNRDGAGGGDGDDATPGNAGGGEGRRGGRGGTPNPAMAAISVNSTPIPHTILLDIAKKVESVMAEKSGTKTLYVGKLTTAAALEASGSGMGGPGSGRGGNNNTPPEASGTVRVLADANGVIEKIEIDSKTKFSFGEGREFERVRKTTIAVSDIGKTKVTVPKEVTEQLKML
jgi:hypothetical protein